MATAGFLSGSRSSLKLRREVSETPDPADQPCVSDPVSRRLGPTAHDAVAGADIVCCCTNSPTPVFEGADLKAGAHVNAVGAYTPSTRETDDETLRRVSRIVVDSRATVAHEAGDIVIPLQRGVISEDQIDAELGEIVLGKKPGRERPDEITLFKSVGNAAQDVAAAAAALRRARELGIGTELNLFA